MIGEISASPQVEHSDGGCGGLFVLKLEEVPQANAELQQAILQSKIENPPPPLLADGYALLKLTRMARSPSVDEALLTAPSLQHCRDRLLEAGCELKPAWAGGARFLVPFVTEQLEELLNQGLEVCDSSILTLRQDIAAVKEALKSLPRKNRPHVSKELQRTGAMQFD